MRKKYKIRKTKGLFHRAASLAALYIPHFWCDQWYFVLVPIICPRKHHWQRLGSLSWWVSWDGGLQSPDPNSKLADLMRSMHIISRGKATSKANVLGLRFTIKNAMVYGVFNCGRTPPAWTKRRSNNSMPLGFTLMFVDAVVDSHQAFAYVVPNILHGRRI